MTTKTKPQPWTLPNGDECSLDGWHYRAGARYSRCLGVPLCPIQSLHAAAPDLLEAAKLADRNIYIDDALSGYRCILDDRRRQTVDAIRNAEDSSRALRQERQENNRKIRAAIAKAEEGR